MGYRREAGSIVIWRHLRAASGLCDSRDRGARGVGSIQSLLTRKISIRYSSSAAYQKRQQLSVETLRNLEIR